MTLAIAFDTGGWVVHLSRSYTVYDIAVGVVWAVLLVLAAALASTSKFHTVLLVFAGFCIGWVSATIARYVYPPPKKYRPSPQQSI